MTTTYRIEDVRIRHDPGNRKYDAWHHGELVGVVVYEQVAGRIVITHAAVQAQHRGHGIGAKLIGEALDDIATLGRPVSVTCPVVRAFIEQHPRYAQLVVPA